MPIYLTQEAVSVNKQTQFVLIHLYLFLSVFY